MSFKDAYREFQEKERERVDGIWVGRTRKRKSSNLRPWKFLLQMKLQPKKTKSNKIKCV